MSKEIAKNVPALLVDADACPVSVRIKLEKASRRYQARLVFFTDQNHEINPAYGEVEVVAQGHDAVDYVLIAQVSPGDVVVTQDYGLAALAISRRAFALHPGGMEYTSQNIDLLLMERHMAGKARKAGERFRNQKRKTNKEEYHFEKQLVKVIEKAMQTFP